MSRVTTSLFKGAKVSIGDVNITGRTWEKYRDSERAFLVGRYMSANSLDGRTWEGGLFEILKKLWPEEFYDKTASEFHSSTTAKRIYYWLKEFGFKNKRRLEGGTIWFLPADLDTRYTERTLRTGNQDRVLAEAKVTYKCICGAGPFDRREEFMAHTEIHEISHAEKENDMATLEAEQAPLPGIGGMVNYEHCPTCNAYVTEQGLKGHLFQAHGQAQCFRCGKTMSYQGLGGHVKTHRTPKAQRELLETIRNMGEGLPLRDYGAALNLTNGAASSRLSGLRERGYVRTEGRRQSMRVFLTSRGRGKKQGFRPGAPRIEPVAKEPMMAKAEPQQLTVAKAEPISPTGIPGGKAATVLETTDGSFIIIMDGRTLFVKEAAEIKS